MIGPALRYAERWPGSGAGSSKDSCSLALGAATGRRAERRGATAGAGG